MFNIKRLLLALLIVPSIVQSNTVRSTPTEAPKHQSYEPISQENKDETQESHSFAIKTTQFTNIEKYEDSSLRPKPTSLDSSTHPLLDTRSTTQKLEFNKKEKVNNPIVPFAHFPTRPPFEQSTREIAQLVKNPATDGATPKRCSNDVISNITPLELSTTKTSKDSGSSSEVPDDVYLSQSTNAVFVSGKTDITTDQSKNKQWPFLIYVNRHHQLSTTEQSDRVTSAMNGLLTSESSTDRNKVPIDVHSATTKENTTLRGTFLEIINSTFRRADIRPHNETTLPKSEGIVHKRDKKFVVEEDFDQALLDSEDGADEEPEEGEGDNEPGRADVQLGDTVHHWERLHEDVSYTDKFVVQVSEGENAAKELAEENGFHFVRRVIPGENYFFLRHKSLPCQRCKREATDHVTALLRDPRTQWVSQQRLLERESRTFLQPTHILHDKSNEFSTDIVQDATERLTAKESSPEAGGEEDMGFNDPNYRDQWYLHNKGQTGAPPHNDINVLPVWKSGITGLGVHVSVLDDGVHGDNPDISRNYDPMISYDFVEMQRQNDSELEENNHGTYCAGIIAAVANNSFCGVGVAYDARVGGTRILDGPVTDGQEAMGLSHSLDVVDIYSASWGPKDDGRQLSGPGPLVQKAIQKGTEQGRQGRGAIYVWAAGNGGKKSDNCNMDGYASSIYTVTFGALTANGLTTYYTEPCAAVLASTYIGGAHRPPTRETIRRIQRMIKVVVPGENGYCRETFQGTSASAPMAAGVISLALQANPQLTWRDVQHLVVKAARIPTSEETGWSINAAGHHFHLKIGFGVVDASRMVALAQNWSLVGRQRTWTTPSNKNTVAVGPGRQAFLAVTVDKNDMDPTEKIDILEHVIATVMIVHSRRKDLEIFLVSPSGTISQVLTRRPYDNSTKGIPMWGFMSVHFWGENPHGRWILRVNDGGGQNQTTGFMNFFSLSIYGTKINEGHQTITKVMNSVSQDIVASITRDEQRLFRETEIQRFQDSTATADQSVGQDGTTQSSFSHGMKSFQSEGEAHHPTTSFQDAEESNGLPVSGLTSNRNPEQVHLSVTDDGVTNAINVDDGEDGYIAINDGEDGYHRRNPLKHPSAKVRHPISQEKLWSSTSKMCFNSNGRQMLINTNRRRKKLSPYAVLRLRVLTLAKALVEEPFKQRQKWYKRRKKRIFAISKINGI